jgi:hypothetical protein
VCARPRLSPFADQIVLIGRWDSRAKRKVHRHQITVAGRRALAARTGELVGIEGPEWSGPRDAQGALNWLEVWDGDGYPYCARVFVYRAGWVKPSNGTAKWSEFVQTNRDGDLIGLWPTMPAHMLGKVAESLALRRAFPDVITDDDVATGYVDLDPGDSVSPAWDIDAEPVEAAGADPPPEAPAPALDGYPLVGDLLSTTDGE